MQSIYPSLSHYYQELEQEFDLITPERKSTLQQLSKYISTKIAADELVQLIVICTHNSRRSHFGQLWLAIAASYYQLNGIQTFSGGTEATAFNERAVAAFKAIGVTITATDEQSNNPRYQVRWKEDQEPYVAFSKKYTAAPNPSENFAAIMVCSDADQNCPLISGCAFKLALPYQDPKQYDATNVAAQEYDKTCREIGREMFFVFQQVQQSLA